MKSKIKWFNNNKGYGYIKYEENGNVSIYLSVGSVLKEIKLNKSK